MKINKENRNKEIGINFMLYKMKKNDLITIKNFFYNIINNKKLASSNRDIFWLCRSFLMDVLRFCDLWLKLAITKLRKEQKVKDDE